VDVSFLDQDLSMIASGFWPSKNTCGPYGIGVRNSAQAIPTTMAPVAQGIEHRIPNPGVACSNHAGGTNDISHLAYSC
jgi:hypothetical protein